jgi:hypothetical protein
VYTHDVIDACIMEAQMNQMTLRHIPAPVEKRLRLHARQAGQSLNKAAVQLLARALGLEQPVHSRRRRDLSRVAGTMSEEQVREFEKNTQAFESIDREMWAQ